MRPHLIFIIAYNAEKTICKVLDRLPLGTGAAADIVVFDDCSTDKTSEVAKAHVRRPEWANGDVKVLKTPENQGYGGNQKLGYEYAVAGGYESVVMVHGDGQYAPELALEMLRPLENNEADCVLGSRMLNKKDALKGGMPAYKWVGNQILTWIENKILGSNLAEFHTGYRAYSVKLLKEIPFRRNSNGFHFDTEILIQAIRARARIKEMAIPTFYGDEKCHVDGVAYAIAVTKACLKAKMQDFGIYYDRKYDFGNEVRYDEKLSMASSHTAALAEIKPGDRVLDIGCGPGFLLREAIKKGAASAVGIDSETKTEDHAGWRTIQHDLESGLPEQLPETSTILLLDVIEHIKNPDKFLQEIRKNYGGRRIVITTPNIAFTPIRLSLLAGQFNYGKYGILDRTHCRLFTFRSLREMLTQNGYEIEKLEGIPAPWAKALGKGTMARALERINIIACRVLRKWASYQILAVARIREEEDVVLEKMQQAEKIS